MQHGLRFNQSEIEFLTTNADEKGTVIVSDCDLSTIERLKRDPDNFHIGPCSLNNFHSGPDFLSMALD